MRAEQDKRFIHIKGLMKPSADRGVKSGRDPEPDPNPDGSGQPEKPKLPNEIGIRYKMQTLNQADRFALKNPGGTNEQKGHLSSGDKQRIPDESL